MVTKNYTYKKRKITNNNPLFETIMLSAIFSWQTFDLSPCDHEQLEWVLTDSNLMYIMY